MEITIGRAPGCDYRITDNHISGNHCKIIEHGGELYIIDLGSANGTFVNGHQIPRQTMMKVSEQDQIVLSGSVMLDWTYISRFFPTVRTVKLQQNQIQNNLNQINPQVKNNNYNVNPIGGSFVDNYLRMRHEQRNYGLRAAIALLLYIPGYILGLIANIVFLVQAQQSKRILGHNPAGYGCVTSLFFVFFVLPMILLLILLAITGGSLYELSRMLR